LTRLNCASNTSLFASMPCSASKLNSTFETSDDRSQRSLCSVLRWADVKKSGLML
jgi:hypothetical protein